MFVHAPVPWDLGLTGVGLCNLLFILSDYVSSRASLNERLLTSCGEKKKYLHSHGKYNIVQGRRANSACFGALGRNLDRFLD